MDNEKTRILSYLSEIKSFCANHNCSECFLNEPDGNFNDVCDFLFHTTPCEWDLSLIEED